MKNCWTKYRPWPTCLQEKGIAKGDRVIIYMPMVPEAAFAMLACARIGAIHSVVFGGFAASELATRIDDATPKLIISASCGIEPGRVIAYKPLLDEAIAMSKNKPATCHHSAARTDKPATLLRVAISIMTNMVAAAKGRPC